MIRLLLLIVTIWASTSACSEGSKSALVFLAPGFEEIELVVTVDILRRAHIDVKIVSILDDKEPVAGLSKIKITPDATLSEIGDGETFDILAMPGGLKAAEAFAASKVLGDLYRRHNDANKIVAAICASPLALNAYKINRNKQITSYPSLEDKLKDNYKYSEDDVVVDGNMVTSRGPGTAYAYGLKLVELLCGTNERQHLADGMVYSH